MKFLIQKNTRTLNEFIQDMKDYRLREITGIKFSNNFTIIETQ